MAIETLKTDTQFVKRVSETRCPICGKPAKWHNMTAMAAMGFDERWGVCEDRHPKFFFVVGAKTKQKVQLTIESARFREESHRQQIGAR
jgi:hypothetical protein